MIQVSGVLKDPFNVPEVGAVIRVIALNSEVSFSGSEAKIITGNVGQYNFNLVNGDFEIEVNTLSEYKLVGNVRIDNSVNGAFTIPQLLTSYSIPIE